MTCDYLRRLETEYKKANKDIDSCWILCLALIALGGAEHEDIAMYMARDEYDKALTRIDELRKERWRNEKG